MPHLASNTEVTIQNAVDLKANGEFSRMRSHKGNMPSLPQTKYCALCPAKFTRTTHLNRHLRSHTNERAHRCNICGAEFTRSDLLTRHKRTCGDSNNVNRSRRKSCQACAESKVKCNLQQPCSKCSSRGKECIFINDPEASRNKKIAKKSPPPRSSASMTPSEGDYSESATSLDSLGPSSPSSSFSFGSHGPDTLPYLVSSSHQQLLQGPSFGVTGVSNVSDCSSSACSSTSSPRLEFYDQNKTSNGAFHLNFDTLGLNDLNVFPNMVDPFIEDNFSPSLPRVQTEADLSGWFETDRLSAAYGNNEPHLYIPPHSLPTHQDFVNGPSNLDTSCSGKPPLSRHQFSTIPPTSQNFTTPFSSPSASHPTPEELNHYLYLFFSEFNIQIPLIHRPTWRMDSSHPVLLIAMQACGALFAKTESSMDFIIKTLASSREIIIAEFSKPTSNLKDRMSLMLAVVLLQSIGLLQPRPDQRALSRLYHEVLVMIIGKTGIIKFIGSWPIPDLSGPQLLESAWRDWARYETFKRTLFFAYLQECHHCVYFSSLPTIMQEQLEINLPSDDDLWRTNSAREWYHLLQTSSRHGLGSSRILGTSFQGALTVLKEQTQTAAFPYVVNQFSAFILVHSILRDIFSPSQPGFALGSSISSTSNSGSNVMAIQSALHTWQQIWQNSTHGTVESQGRSTPFVHDAYTFYWLARLAQGAQQTGHLQARPLSNKAELEERYQIVKAWLNQIKANNVNFTNDTILLQPHHTPEMASFSHSSNDPSLSMFSRSS